MTNDERSFIFGQIFAVYEALYANYASEEFKSFPLDYQVGHPNLHTLHPAKYCDAMQKMILSAGIYNHPEQEEVRKLLDDKSYLMDQLSVDDFMSDEPLNEFWTLGEAKYVTNFRLGIGHKIAELRQAKGLRQVDLAEQIGCSQNDISRWEIGQHHPSQKYLELLSEALDFDFENFTNCEAFTTKR